jgi:carboxyl-terminal processing protease
VQTIIPLNGHGALRLTTALYYTPAGRSIQGQGIAPDVVVEAPKEQQIAGVVLPHESSLRGAFRNPGRLGKKATDKKATDKKDGKEMTAAQKTKNSPPIKADLIGTDEDAQLKAALSYLEKNKATSAASKG